MDPLRTPLDLFKHLPKTNCARCGAATCLAFAAAVINGDADLSDCPLLDPGAREQLARRVEQPVNLERIRESQVQEMRGRIAGIDLLSRAAILGGVSNGRTLTIKCLGRDFEVDRQGAVASQCHTHAWFTLPLLDYILQCSGGDAAGGWVRFRDLEHGAAWGPLFERRCEMPLKRIADAFSGLFGDLVQMFSAQASPPAEDSDLAVVLHPFPRVPVMICYWRQEEGMESRLRLFFDAHAERNLPIGSIFTLGTGLARMLERIMYTHTGGRSELS